MNSLQVRLLPEILKGAIMGSLLVAAYAVADHCTQIDAYAKVADYYERYVEYKQQIDQWKDLAAQTVSDITGIADNVRGALDETKASFEQDWAGIKGLYDPGQFRIHDATLEVVGELNREHPARDALEQCWRQQLGADFSSSAKCSPDSQEARKLRAVAIQPSTVDGGVRPNTAMTVEAMRAVTYGDWPILDLLRSDLAWIRDNDRYRAPFNYPATATAISAAEVQQRVSDMQRVASILYARGAGSEKPVPANKGLARNEFDAMTASRMGLGAMASDAMSEYAAVYPEALLLRQSISSMASDEIDRATEAQRYAMRLQASTIESRLDLMIQESRLRQEGLDAALGIPAGEKQITSLVRSKP